MSFLRPNEDSFCMDIKKAACDSTTSRVAAATSCTQTASNMESDDELESMYVQLISSLVHSVPRAHRLRLMVGLLHVFDYHIHGSSD